MLNNKNIATKDLPLACNSYADTNFELQVITKKPFQIVRLFPNIEGIREVKPEPRCIEEVLEATSTDIDIEFVFIN